MHYEVDEKAQNVVLTDQGVKDCEKARMCRVPFVLRVLPLNGHVVFLYV